MKILFVLTLSYLRIQSNLQQGKDGRDRVYYKQLGYHPDLTGKDASKLLQIDGYYFEEVRRDHIYQSQDAILNITWIITPVLKI